MTNVNQREIDIAEWLLHHSDELLKDIHKRHNPCYHLFPSFLQDTYNNIYEDNVLNMLREQISKAFHLNYEETSLLISRKYVIMILGEKILLPPKENKKDEQS